MSAITYNGITLPYANTTSFRQDSVADEVGQTDRYLTKFDIQVQAVINFSYLSMVAPALVAANGQPATTNPAEIMRYIRTSLMQYRKKLSYIDNGQELIPIVTSNVGTVDAKNGPMPQSCNCYDMTNQTFMITFHIIAHYWEKNNFNENRTPHNINQQTPSILFNRWTETVDIDKLNMTTRTRNGKFAIRADNREGAVPDDFRFLMAGLSIPSGFNRERSKYTQTPDGLALEYQIVDKEVFKQPPSPALDAEGEFMEYTADSADAKKFVEVRVMLMGGKNNNFPNDFLRNSAPQADLIRRCIAVAVRKLHTQGAPLVQDDPARPVPLATLRSASVRVGMYNNYVECKLKALAPTDSSRMLGTILSRASPFTPFSDDFAGSQNPPARPFYGSAGLMLQAAAYFDPNLASALSNTGQMSRGLVPGEGGVFRE